MKQKRPIYLNLFKIRLPVPAFASILHRLSGVIVFLLIPMLLWLLHRSLFAPQQFQQVSDVFANPVCKFFVWVVLSALLYHLVAGIRHLIMDLGYGESLKVGRGSAIAVIIISVILIVLAGIWIW